jgi:hypothetical protein
MAAVDRVEVLKDGASAIYGTDAIGGVINFILRKNYNGLQAAGLHRHHRSRRRQHPRRQAGGRLRRPGQEQLQRAGDAGAQREQGAARRPARLRQHLPARPRPVGGHPRHAGTPRCLRSAAFTARSAATTSTTPAAAPAPRCPARHADLQRHQRARPAGAPAATASTAWAPTTRCCGPPRTPAFGCAWDTGRAAVLQQPVKNTNAVARGTVRLGEHQLVGEFTGAKVKSAKSFSANQISTSTTASNPFFNLAYPSTGAAYNEVFNQLVGASRRSRPTAACRWPCAGAACPAAPREVETQSDTKRVLLAADGPLGAGWDYRAGISQATSQTRFGAGQRLLLLNAVRRPDQHRGAEPVRPAPVADRRGAGRAERCVGPGGEAVRRQVHARPGRRHGVGAARQAGWRRRDGRRGHGPAQREVQASTATSADLATQRASSTHLRQHQHAGHRQARREGGVHRGAGAHHQAPGTDAGGALRRLHRLRQHHQPEGVAALRAAATSW